MNDSTVAATKTIKEEAETSAGMFIIPIKKPKKVLPTESDWFSYLVGIQECVKYKLAFLKLSATGTANPANLESLLCP